MTKRTNRRTFLGQTAAAGAIGAGYWTSTSKQVRAQDSALQGLTAACIGVGGKGSSDASHIAENGVKLVGLCDVDSLFLEKKALDHPDAEKFSDFREMLEKLGDKVDIVTVSTPDHTHAAAAVRAMRMKKHVYCQKPLTWSISEARLMRQTAEETGVVTQMGNQGTSEDGLREAVEVIQSGAIGDVSEVHIWSNRPVWPQGQGRPAGEDPVPDTLNWDAWIGPAQMRPFKKGAYHSFNWRGWVDFGTGALGDMACHTTNMPVMALKLWDPIAVTAVKNPGIVEGESYPGSSSILFEFPEREGLPACKFRWYDGGELPSDDLISQLPARYQKKIAEQRAGGNKQSGALVVGSKGMLFSENDYGARYVLLPRDQYADFELPAQTLPRIPFKANTDLRQKWEFVETCKGDYEPGTMSNFGYAGRLTETILVGNLALRAGEGQRIEWDAENLKSTNMPAINEFVAREYREGWEV
ncbi:Gfo/Idh/MocA family protein [Rhodopirellula sp. MGV]|uniref:Gfo/Idh/MocA family protein n=1 Tax=Rhodopirellula sp. MGV TaxID=2023130 RepID=UPI000B96131A|nr:Gfo/Idh/MocA family oxidoreductase [Rhodopirellula sp. MGV]OYP36687.1 dehydrogenase [Rhodopirellula sp. MGV]PNY38223.1 gfo/Idh/MocA family oxidoreductase [Rhodopirellula baltica]